MLHIKLPCQAVSAEYLENNYSLQLFELEGQSCIVNTLATKTLAT